MPVIEGAGGSITDWKGHKLHWEASPESRPTSMAFLHKIYFFFILADKAVMLEVVQLGPPLLRNFVFLAHFVTHNTHHKGLSK